MKNAASIRDLAFHSFEGFSCYDSMDSLEPSTQDSPTEDSPTEDCSIEDWPTEDWPQETHQHVEIIVLFENAIAQIIWHEDESSRKKPLMPGQICIIPREQHRQLIRQQGTPLMAIQITPQLIVETTHQTLRTPQWSFQGAYGIKDEVVLSLAKALRQWLHKKGAIAKLYRQSLVKLLAVHLIANYAQADFKQDSDPASPEDSQLSPVIKYIHTHLDQDLKVSDLAKKSQLSQSHFCRIFKKSMGLSPYQYIMYRRIAKAKTLLNETTLSLAEISFQCGFYDQSHFILQFRRFTGNTPKAYRDKAKAAHTGL